MTPNRPCFSNPYHTLEAPILTAFSGSPLCNSVPVANWFFSAENSFLGISCHGIPLFSFNSNSNSSSSGVYLAPAAWVGAGFRLALRDLSLVIADCLIGREKSNERYCRRSNTRMNISKLRFSSSQATRIGPSSDSQAGVIIFVVCVVHTTLIILPIITVIFRS